MPKIQNFSENLEQSFNRLGNKIDEKMASPEVPGRSEREVVKESVRAIAESAPITSPPTPPAPPAAQDQSFLPAYLSSDAAPEEVKRAVEQLVAFTFKTDIETAVVAAKRYPPFVEDAFHDALVDKLMPELKKRGYLK
ncbi:hypothetical protein M1432_01200 [Patescibacteria group bacterium]|nr:hypothetical protein [Patescibacteria group bacterium]